MRSSPRDQGLVLLGAVLLAVLFTWPIAPRLMTAGRVDSSDARHGMWNLAWVAHTLTTNPGNLFHANIFHPHPNTLASSEANIVGGLIALPAWLVTRDAVASFNWTILWAFILSGVATYALVRHLGGTPAAALFSGLCFAGSPYMFSRLSHIQLLMTFGLSWTLLAFHRYLDRPRAGRAVQLGLVLAVTALACGYYGIFMGLVVAWGFVWFGIGPRGRDLRHWWHGLFAAGIAAAVVAPFFIPYLGVRAAGFERTLDEARAFSVGWQSYLASAALAHRWMLPLIGDWTAVLFPGTLPVLLSLAAVWFALRPSVHVGARVERRVLGFYASVVALAAWLSFGPDAGLYRVLYDLIPAFGWLRDTSRFGVLVSLGLAVIGGLAFTAMSVTVPPRARLALQSGVIGAALAGTWVGPIYGVPRSPTPPVYAALARLPPGPVAEFPYFTDAASRHRHTEYMLGATVHWKPLLNGSSDVTPADAFADGFWLARFPEAEAWQVLERRGARYLVVHWAMYEPAAAPRASVAWLLRHGHLREILHRDGAGLYEIVRWPNP